MRKFVIILTIILLYSVACKKEDFLWDLPKNTCNYLYSDWTPCLNNIQTRTYTSSPSRCKGTPPGDSIQRTCVPCKFVYSAWSSCTNNVQTRTYTIGPQGCISIGLPPADSIQRTCVPCKFVYSAWSLCSNNIQTRTYTIGPQGCIGIGLPPADSIQKNCTLVLNGQGVWDRDMNFYETKIYDNQNWFSKNLEVSTYRNGDLIPQVQNANAWAFLNTGAWCYYANNTANGIIYGKLYNWYAVNDPRGLAPNGYHIPSDAEWSKLTNWLGGEIVAGGKMKEQGLSHWNAPNFGASNISLFSALPGGYREDNGYFFTIGAYGFWWSSSETFIDFAYSRYLYTNNGDVYRNYHRKQNGFSVRCIKD